MLPDPLPARYGTDRVVAIARDCQRLFVLWELTPEGVGAAKDSLGPAAVGATLTLRLSDELGQTQDQAVGDWLGQRTLSGLRPGGAYVIAVGFFAADCFAPVAMSPPMVLPDAADAP